MRTYTVKEAILVNLQVILGGWCGVLIGAIVLAILRPDHAMFDWIREILK